MTVGAEAFPDRPDETNIEQPLEIEVDRINNRQRLLDDMKDVLDRYVETGLDGFTELLASDGIWIYDNDSHRPNLGVGIHIKAESDMPFPDEDTRYEVLTSPEDDKEIEAVVITCKTGAEQEQIYTINPSEDIGPEPPEQAMRNLEFIDFELYRTGVRHG